MVELFEQDIRTNDRQSSKGNQLKWESDGNWYKADYTGYERLFKNFFGESLYKSIFKIADYEGRLMFLVRQVERMTGLREFGKYMNKLFTIDAFFLNEDRHTHNIAVLMDGNGKFDYCPIFDNGAGLLSDTALDYPLGGDVSKYMQAAKAKTICSNFDEQLDISEKLYGDNIRFTFSEKDVKNIIAKADIYSDDERNRVERILCMQIRKYQYLFAG